MKDEEFHIEEDRPHPLLQAWAIADNQAPILKDLEKFGAVKLTSAKGLKKSLGSLHGDNLRVMSQKAMQLCDAEGATRVANKLWSFNEQG